MEIRRRRRLNIIKSEDAIRFFKTLRNVGLQAESLGRLHKKRVLHTPLLLPGKRASEKGLAGAKDILGTAAFVGNAAQQKIRIGNTLKGKTESVEMFKQHSNSEKGRNHQKKSMEKIKILKRRASSFVKDDGEEMEYFWYKGVRERDSVTIEFGSKDGDHELDTTVDVTLEKTEAPGGKFRYKEIV